MKQSHYKAIDTIKRVVMKESAQMESGKPCNIDGFDLCELSTLAGSIERMIRIHTKKASK